MRFYVFNLLLLFSNALQFESWRGIQTVVAPLNLAARNHRNFKYLLTFETGFFIDQNLLSFLLN